LKIFTIPDLTGINSDKQRAYKEENSPAADFELEAHLLQRRIPKNGKPSAEDKNAGHRERLRNRFDKSEFTGFNDYEILEFMLSYPIHRKDTKVLSKNLLKMFGSFKGILSADKKELEQIDGIGRQSVIFIKALPAFIKIYFENQAENNEIQFTELEQTAKYFKATIGNYKNEVVKVLYLNSENKMIHTELIDAGTVNESYLNYRRIVETALISKSTSVIIAHNHADGIPEPSENDNIVTRKIAEVLKVVDIDLQDHIIIASKGFYSYRKQGIL